MCIMSVLQLDVLEALDQHRLSPWAPAMASTLPVCMDPTARLIAERIDADHSKVAAALRRLSVRGLVAPTGAYKADLRAPGPTARTWASRTPDTLIGHVCTELRRARIEAGWSRRGLARRLDVSERSVSRAELCGTLPRFADRWAQLCGLRFGVRLMPIEVPWVMSS